MNRRYEYDDEDERPRRQGKGAKHSRNIPGKGMRIINSWYDEDEDYDYDDFEEDVEVTDHVTIVHTKNSR